MKEKFFLLQILKLKLKILLVAIFCLNLLSTHASNRDIYDLTSANSNDTLFTVLSVRDVHQPVIFADPIAVNDSNTTPQDITLTVIAANGVLLNDSDPDIGDVLSVTQFVVGGTIYAVNITANLAEGDLTIGSDGSYTFVPTAGFIGTVPTATYTVSDNVIPTASTATANLDIEVLLDTDGDGDPDISDPDDDNDGNPDITDPNILIPTAVDDAFTAPFGGATPFNILTNDDFIPGSNITITRIGGTAAGTVTFDNATGGLSYTPTSAEATTGGSVSVIYQVCHTVPNPDVCATATVSITITDADNDGDGVTNGQEAIDGTDPNDGCAYNTTNQIIANVSPAWNALDCDGDGVINGTEITDSTDPKDPCSLFITSQTVTPNGAWNAADCDDDGNRNATDPNPLTPTAVNDAFTAPFGGATIFNILTNDDFLPSTSTTINRIGGSAAGTVTFSATAGTLSYTPTAAEATAGGSVSVIYQVCHTVPNPDVCATATVIITIADADDDGDGVSNGQEAADGTNPNDGCDYNTASQVIVNVSTAWNSLDCDGDGVINGTEIIDSTDPKDPCSLVIGSQTVTPNAAWNAADCDDDGNPNATDPNPLTPTAVNDAFTAPFGGATTFNILANDDFIPSTSTTINQAGGTAAGTVSFSATVGTLSYSPTAAEATAGGSVSVIYQVCHTVPNPDVCVTATVIITIADADDDGDGVSNGQEVADGTDPDNGCDYNTASQVIANVSTAWNNLDCDGDGVINGTEIIDGSDPKDPCSLIIANQTVTPNASWNATDCDSDGNPNATDPNPLTPTALDDAFTAPFGETTTFNILANDDFLPSTSTTINQTGGSAAGTVTFSATTGTLSYTPTAAEASAGVSVSVIYQVCHTIPNPDVCTTAMVSITIADADDDGDGVSNGQEVADGTDPDDGCDYNTASQVIANVSTVWNNLDCDGDGVINGTEIVDGTDPKDPCSLIITNQTVTPNAAWNVLDCDADGNPNATDPNPLTPTAVDDAFTAPFGGATTFNILANDDFLPGTSTTINQVGGTAAGTVIFGAIAGNLSYTPTAAEASAGGSVSVIYQVCHTVPNPDVCTTATVIITIADADDDGDGVSNGQEVADGTDPDNGCDYNTTSQVIANVSTVWNNLDCDGDGVINGTEITDITDPKDPCSLVMGSQTVTPNAAWDSADCDNDGNPNATDPNPLTPFADNDAFTAPFGGATTFNILANDDFLPSTSTTLNQSGGTASGSVTFNTTTGEMSYTPTAAEATAGGSVSVIYQVCYTVPNPDVCASATVNITIADADNDGDGVSDGQEVSDGTNPNDGCDYNTASQILANVSSTWNNLDCDGDGVINGTEITEITDPKDPCSLVIGSQTVTPNAAWDAADCDSDGNPNATDPNPLVPIAIDDTFTAPFEVVTTFNILENDDFLPGTSTTITQTGGTAAGTIFFSVIAGTLSYSPTALEVTTGVVVSIEYQVCYTAPSPDVCATATVSITVTDADDDGDGVTNGQEVTDGTDPDDGCDFDPDNRTSDPTEAWSALDCDGDRVSNGDEDGLDTDNDGTPDYLDIDDDNDGINTINEDADGNGDPRNDDCDNDSIPNYLDSNSCGIVAPTLFTPNGDGVNDEFVILELVNRYPNFEMIIYNRWGNIVYDYKNDGRSQPLWWGGLSTGRMTINRTEKVPTGTYFYIINFNDINKKPVSGWVYLNR